MFNTKMIKKQLRVKNRAINWGLMLAAALCFGCATTSLAVAPFEDSFEEYTLGDLHNQGEWIESGSGNWQVNWERASEGIKSIYCDASYCRASKTGDLVGTGNWTIDFYLDSGTPSPCGRITTIGVYDPIQYVFSWKTELDDGICKVWKSHTITDYTIFGEVVYDVWHSIKVEWRPTEIRFKLDENEWTEWQYTYTPFYGVNKIYLDSTLTDKKHYIDNLSSELPELRVWGISPESGSTATTTEDNFTLGWEGWDFEWIYKDFVFSFFQKDTGILVGSKIFEPLTESGTKIYKFSDFGIDKNGKYNFHAKARSYLSIEYPVYYTGDLVYPAWWIIIDVEGWEWIFQMPEFEEWYSEHSKFASSTAIFSGVAGFLEPVYNKIGEFGNRVVAFLNLDEAYDRGYDLGKIIPTFRHYISEIEVFFGGFPIIQLFLAFLVILLGFFIVRLILKFIPTLG